MCRRIQADEASTEKVDSKLEPLEPEVCGSVNRTSEEKMEEYRDIGKSFLTSQQVISPLILYQ